MITFNSLLVAGLVSCIMASSTLAQKPDFAATKAAHEKVMEALTKSNTSQLDALKQKAGAAVDKFVDQKRAAAKLEEVVSGEKFRKELAGENPPEKPAQAELEKIWKTYTAAAAVLKKQELEAVRKASQPYVQDLERMKQQLTREGATEKALIVKAEIDRLNAGDNGVALKSKVELHDLLLGSDVEWIPGPNVYSTFKLEDKDKIKGGGLLPWLVKWEVVSKDEVKIYHSDGGYWVFKLDTTTGQGQPVPARGAKQDFAKKIHVLPKAKS
jgi:hypothetical protein